MEPSSDISIESIDVNVQKSSLIRVRKRKKQLYTDLRKQIEFYLSDANLRKDRYFGNLMQTNHCINIETFLNCNKIKNLTTNPEDIIKALETSNVLSVSDCKTKIHRIKPIEDKSPEEIERCTVYVEQLPPKADHDWVKSIFEKYGNVAYISLPKFKSGTIKRFAFVEFDNEESTNKVLEEHKKLHEESKILPEELQSIITFNEDEKNEDSITKVDKNIDINLVKKRKHSSSHEVIKEKRMKKDVVKVGLSGTIKTNKKKKKDKHKKNDLDSDQKNSSFEISENEINQRDMLNENLNSSFEKLEDTSSVDDRKPNNIALNDTVLKKKRKRNKGKKGKSDVKLTTPGLRIMSKTEWKKLRNQFLNMQRQKMSLLKAQLQRPRFISNNSNTSEKNDPTTNFKNVEIEKPVSKDVRVKYEPGVILKVSFSTPIESDKAFKAEAKTDSKIKFVDVINNFEAYVRCDCQESATKIANENRWPQTRHLEGEEEKLYWEKILFDRENKCTKQKESKNQRGRSKLINKAEKRLAQHVKFIQENE